MNVNLLAYVENSVTRYLRSTPQ